MSLEFRQDFWHRRTRVSELSYGVVSLILCLAIFVQLRLVTDGQTDRQTDRHTMTANTALAQRRAVKTHNFWRVVKMMVLFLAASGPTLMKFQDDVGNSSSFPMLFPGSLCRVPSRRYWPSNLSLSCEVVENRDSFWAPNFVGVITQKSLRSVLSLTDARHVLTFLKDSFRGVDGLDYPLMNSSKISFWAPNVCIGRGHKMFYSNLLL